MKSIIKAWLTHQQLDTDGPFQYVTGELGWGDAGGVAVAVLMWFKHTLFIIGLFPVPGEAGGKN